VGDDGADDGESPPEPDTGGSRRAGRLDQDLELQRSLAGLSSLATAAISLPNMLSSVAEFAVRAIPGADGAGLTLLHDDRADTIVASADFVREVDAIQYGIGEGPCITAAAEGRTVSSGSLGGDRTWPRFGPRVGRLGVHSVVSLPLQVDGVVLGAMNVYAHAKDAFDERAIALGELFAVPAAVAVQNAGALANARLLASQLQAALDGRAVIDQALGIVMSRSGCTPLEAFDRLRAISQSDNRKVSAVAQSIVDEAVRRARARHTGD
jgi:transcriptional regulator with GAF, ATPase, and Fis domain